MRWLIKCDQACKNRPSGLSSGAYENGIVYSELKDISKNITRCNLRSHGVALTRTDYITIHRKTPLFVIPVYHWPLAAQDEATSV